MKIGRYWTKRRAEAVTPSGKLVAVIAYGWSLLSREEAVRRADESARRAAARIAAGEPFPRGYDYADRPAREEVVEEFKGDGGEPVAAVTRNSYGSLVLNTKDLMFIDVDLPPEDAGGQLLKSIKRLFGAETEDAETRTRKKIEAAAASRPEYTFRLYRTAAGFRCAVVNRRVSPDSPESRRLLEEFGADPLYVKLCQSQRSYRARLTPKYWRCMMHRPPSRFPWETLEEEQSYRAWEREYEERCGRFAACRFVGQFGAQEGDAELRMLVDLHDRYTKADSNLELA